MTHGYDDQGRKFDGHSNLHNWWTPADVKAFDDRAQLVVNEYAAFSPLPGQHVNGKLTLGENLADLGGVNIAYEALERDWAKHPAKRKKLMALRRSNGFYFVRADLAHEHPGCGSAAAAHGGSAFAGTVSVYGPLLNLSAFYQAFHIPPGSLMWLPPDQRAHIW